MEASKGSKGHKRDGQELTKRELPNRYTEMVFGTEGILRGTDARWPTALKKCAAEPIHGTGLCDSGDFSLQRREMANRS